MLDVKRNFSVLVCMFCCPLIHAQDANTAERKIVPVISSRKYTEFAPTISADGRTMIFESNREKDWKLYESHRDEKGNWSEPYPITAINEKLNFLAGPSLSYDGNTLFFTGFIENVTTSEDIFFSNRVDGKTWSEPKNIGTPINTDQYEGFPSVSADGNSFYFVRINDENPIDKKSKENCFRIFLSQKKSDGSWADPEPLPSPINMGCERDPKIMADNNTLIFSSILPNGKGKFDLYETRKNVGKWSDPVPLDFVNSPENDQSICISASGDVMFFYSKDDIYSTNVPKEYRQQINITVQGYVLAEISNEPVLADIFIKNITTGESFTTSSQAHNGQYGIVLSAGHQYAVEFSSPLHVAAVHVYDLRQQDKYTEIKKDVQLQANYKLIMTVQDKDLNKPLDAWFQAIDESGQVLMKDSLKADKYPYDVILQAGKNYNFLVSSSGYNASTREWKYDRTFKTEVIHSVKLEHIKVPFTTDVVNIVSNQKVKTKIYFNNENGNEVITADAGETVYLREGDRYQVVTSSDKGFMFSSATVVPTVESKENPLVLKVIPVEAGAHITLDHIGFAVNSYDLNATSFLILERVVELLKTNPLMSIQISAHTDDVGEELYNLKLSGKRALTIVRYLNKNGIDYERMRPVGHGKSKPLVPNDNEENRALNRRVELEVLRVN